MCAGQVGGGATPCTGEQDQVRHLCQPLDNAGGARSARRTAVPAGGGAPALASFSQGRSTAHVDVPRTRSRSHEAQDARRMATKVTDAVACAIGWWRRKAWQAHLNRVATDPAYAAAAAAAAAAILAEVLGLLPAKERS